MYIKTTNGFTVLGDVCWWFMLTFFINKIRNRFDLKGLWMINRILGTVLISAALGWFIFILCNC
jgi:plastocyanin domain-containing protein